MSYENMTAAEKKASEWMKYSLRIAPCHFAVPAWLLPDFFLLLYGYPMACDILASFEEL
jgi:hypothetical protein